MYLGLYSLTGQFLVLDVIETGRGCDENDDARSNPVAERPINGSGRSKGRAVSGIYNNVERFQQSSNASLKLNLCCSRGETSTPQSR